MPNKLTAKEQEILGCVLNGSTNNEIAEELEISVNTVKTHLKHIYQKRAVSSRQQLIVKILSKN